VHDEDPIAREVARCLAAVFGAGVGVQAGHKRKGLGRDHVIGRLVELPPADRRRGGRLSGHDSCGCCCSRGGRRRRFARRARNQPRIVLQVQRALQQHKHDGQQADGWPCSPRREGPVRGCSCSLHHLRCRGLHRGLKSGDASSSFGRLTEKNTQHLRSTIRGADR